MYLAFCSIVIIFNIRLSSVCLMMINVFDRKLTFYFLNTSDGFLCLRPSNSYILYLYTYISCSSTSILVYMQTQSWPCHENY